MDIQYYIYNNKKIAYTITGNGPVLVLMHGFMECQQIWNDFAADLSKKYKIVTIDLPGHGESECIDNVHTMDLMAYIINAVLLHLEINKCVLIGHSMGGYVSLAFAEKYPEMLMGLGLFHSHPFADTDEAKKNRDRSCEIVKQNRAGFISAFIPELFAPENVEKYHKEIKQLQQYIKDMTVEAIVASQQGMKLRKDRTAVIKNAAYPVLLIFGKQDPRTPIPKMLEQITYPKHCEILIIDVGHMGYIEAKKETLHTINSFTEKCFNE